MKLEDEGCEAMARPQDVIALRNDLAQLMTFQDISSKIRTPITHSHPVNKALNSAFDIHNLRKPVSLKSPQILHVLHPSTHPTVKQYFQFQQLTLITTSERNPT